MPTVNFDESDYELNINQARQIQANLVASGRPQRLLSDAELAEKEREKREKREKVKEVCAISSSETCILALFADIMFHRLKSGFASQIR